jgi:hypothetical protein
VERKHSVLVTEDAEDRAEQVDGDIRDGCARGNFHAHKVAVADVVAGNALDVEEVLGCCDLTDVFGSMAAEYGGDRLKPDRHLIQAGAGTVAELRYVDLRQEMKWPEVEISELGRVRLD